MKKIYKNIILFLITIVVIILLLESVFRILAPQATYSSAKRSSPRIWAQGDYISVILKPNSKDEHIGLYGDFNVFIEINSYGLRDYEKAVDKNLIKILVLGDSMTFGYGVEMNESYPKQLEKMLNKNGVKFQVFNAGGADGDSPGTYYLYIKNYAIQKFNPDIIILGFTYTDITDPRRYEVLEDKNGLPVKIRYTHLDVDNEGRAVITKSAIPLLKYGPIYKIYEGLLTYSHLFAYINNLATKVFLVRFRDRYYDINMSSEIEGYWNFNKKAMLAIRDIANKNKKPLMIITVPYREQINDRLWKDYSKIIGEERLNRTKPNDMLKEFGQENNITVIDMYNKFHEKNMESSLYLKVDGHINPEGHKVLAEEIYNYILSKK